MSTSEPWVWEPVDPDPVCGHCGSDSWNDEKAACTACGDTIYDVAERIAAQTKRPECLRPPWHPDCYWPNCKCGGEAFQRAQAIRDHQTQGGPE